MSNAIFLTYGGGTQTLVGNYAQQISQPSTCTWWNRLCWLRCTDYNSDGTISQTEFNALFLTLDEDGDNSLDDETELPGLFYRNTLLISLPSTS